ncbi:MAG: hypothetical protein KDK70_19600, partial [Myxococcales bacterium]|nr:hypothetical protein [Myxococcales bacterium]
MRWLATALWLVIAGCERSEASTDAHAPEAEPPSATHGPTAPPLRPLEVLLGGCDEQGPGPRCALTSDRRRLTLWVEEPSARSVEVSIDGVPVTATPAAAEHGLRWTIEVPAEAAVLQARRRDAPPRVEPFTLALRTTDEASVAEREALDREATRAWNAGDIAAIEPIHERARARGHRAVATRWAHNLAFHYVGERELTRGRWWLDRAGALLPQETAVHLYFRGLLAETRGDLGDALVAYRRSLRRARALGAGLQPVLRLAALGQVLTIMAQTGDRAGALEAMREGLQVARSPSMSALHRAKFLDTAAWALLVSGPYPEVAASPYDPRALLDQARALLGDQPEGEPEWFTVRLNLAYDALERGETAAARWWLDALVGRRLPRTDALWQRLLRARVDRLEGRLGLAREGLEAMVADADRHRDHGLRWGARVEHARVLEELGRISEALAEYAEADALLEQQLSTVGMGERERFLAGREAVARRRVELLLDHDRPEAALCAARLARTRALRSLDRRLRRDADRGTRRALDEYLGTRLRLDDAYDQTFWIASAARAERRRAEIDHEREANAQRFEAIMRGSGGHRPSIPDCGALSTPGAGMVDLHYFQLDRGWVGFSMDERGRIVHRVLTDPKGALDEDDPMSLGALLLDPFEDVLATARRVRIMASGPLYGVAFHGLPLGAGGPRLQDGRAVVYGLDLPIDPRTSDVAGPAIVLEPPSNLPRAHEEAELSVAGLRRRGVEVRALTEGEPVD